MKCTNNLKQMALACHNCNDANGRMPPQAGTYGGAYFGPLLFHLLPYIEQKNVWTMAMNLDYNAGVGQVTPNPASTTNLGVVWPTWQSVNTGSNTWLRQTRISVYQCPSDPSLGNAIDWNPGDASYAGNFQVFGGAVNTGSNSNWGRRRELGFHVPGRHIQHHSLRREVFQLQRRRQRRHLVDAGVYHGYQGAPGGADDSYPGDLYSAVFAGGVGTDGTVWTTGAASKFLVQPLPFNKNPGPCDKRLASSPHIGGMNVGLGDGSVRFLSAGMSGTTWWDACTPAGGETMPSDW